MLKNYKKHLIRQVTENCLNQQKNDMRAYIRILPNMSGNKSSTHRKKANLSESDFGKV